jgi:phenylacetate-CoA ligase
VCAKRPRSDGTQQGIRNVNAPIARQILYPLHERIRRRPTFRILAELEDSQWLSPGEIRDLQARKLRRLFRHAAAKCRWYAETFRVHRIDPDCDDPFDALKRLPLLSRAGVRKHLSDMTDQTVPGGVRPMSTGGSTGEPLKIFVDRTREAYDKAARMRTHRWFGIEPGDKEIYLWGAPIDNRRQDRLRNFRDVFLNDLLLSAFDLTPDSMRDYLRRIKRFNPCCIFGYPSSLVEIARFAKRKGVKLELPDLQAVFVTGEVLDDQQRATLESAFHVPVANGYGGRDFGFCAHQCERGKMHITSEHLLVEIVDADGRSLPTGQSGQIVVTNLDNFATHLIRYDTGDIGRLLPDTCRCGRGLQAMSMVAGRRTDHLVAADGTLRHALSAIYLMRETEGISRFQIRQHRDRSVAVSIVPEPTFDQNQRDNVVNGLRQCFGDAIDTRINLVDRIDVEPSGKFRYVVSEAAAP